MQSNKKEMLSCIDGNNCEISAQPRAECHGNPQHLHRVIHVIIQNDSGQFLAQKRAATKDIQPGKWDTSVGGHVDPGETPEDAARRECQEELGLELSDLELMYDYVWITDVESEKVYTFRAVLNQIAEIKNEEVDEVCFLDGDTLDRMAKEQRLTPNFVYELAKYSQWLKNPGKQSVDYPIFDMCRCEKCQRLVTYRNSISGKGKLLKETYWNRPVPGLGDLNARLLVVGLAPGAHGANRSGRPFTGDTAGDVLYRTLHELGYCSKPTTRARGDGLWLKDVFITNAVKCVPPENKPSTAEVNMCRAWLETELRVLNSVKGIVCLGRVAFEAVKRMFKARYPDRNRWKGCQFSHGFVFNAGPELPFLAGLYHPSRRNLNTGLITYESFTETFQNVCRKLELL